MSAGYAFGGKRARMMRAKLDALRERNRLDQFAELLAHHDLESGHPGGDVPECARAMGLRPVDGNAMLQRIRKRLGPQAR